jgi:4-hydroxybenzoate polyprenyltransferase
MIYFLRLVRFQNLVIIALTQYLFRYAILIPILKLEQLRPAFGNISFALLVLSTVLVAAAGYAINDYFDIRNDRINKPGKIIIGKHISRRVAMLTHTVFSIAAVMIGAYVSYKAGSIKLAVINIIMVTLLWMYSLRFKAYFLAGNVLVSFSTAMTIVMVWIYDLYALHSSQQYVIVYSKLLMFFLAAYSLFAFFMSMLREIIKDIEDIEGDKKCGCSTIPVVIGIKKTKYILYFLITAAVAALSYISYKTYTQLHLHLLFWYLVVVVIVPLLYMAYVVIVAKKKEDYSFLSSVTKFIMLSGVLSMLLIFVF